MNMTQEQKTERFVVKPIIKFNMLFGYRVWDNKKQKSTIYDHYDDEEQWRAQSKADLLNALNQ